MKFTSFLTLAVAAAVGAASPILEKRQSYGTKWNDPYIPIPQKFQFRSAGAQCDFQVAYERFAYDNRYDVQYLAVYADGSQARTSGISGSLPRNYVWLVDGLPDSRAIQAIFFPSVCKSGSAPVGLRANFALRNGYTYQNRWTTGNIAVTAGAPPAAPSNVKLTASASPRSSTVTWNAVQGASGYVVLMEWLTDSEVGLIPFQYARKVGAVTSYTYNRQFTRAAVVAISGGTIANGAKAFTPLDDVADVRPS